MQVDVRYPESVQNLIDQTISVCLLAPLPSYLFVAVLSLKHAKLQTYGRLDVLVYNSGAIFWAPVARTDVKRFQLMQRVNPEGLYATVQAALPHMRPHGRLVVVSPHLQPLLPRQDSLRHGQGRHERPDKGAGHGL